MVPRNVTEALKMDEFCQGIVLNYLFWVERAYFRTMSGFFNYYFSFILEDISIPYIN